MIIYTDGGCTNSNQKDQSIRQLIMVATDDSGEVLVERIINGGSNNIAELLAVLYALEWVMEEFILSDIVIKTDSKIAIGWIESGKFGKHLNNRELVAEIREKIAALCKDIKVSFEWVPREKSLAGHYIENKYNL